MESDDMKKEIEDFREYQNMNNDEEDGKKKKKKKLIKHSISSSLSSIPSLFDKSRKKSKNKEQDEEESDESDSDSEDNEEEEERFGVVGDSLEMVTTNNNKNETTLGSSSSSSSSQSNKPRTNSYIPPSSVEEEGVVKEGIVSKWPISSRFGGPKERYLVLVCEEKNEMVEEDNNNNIDKFTYKLTYYASHASYIQGDEAKGEVRITPRTNVDNTFKKKINICRVENENQVLEFSTSDVDETNIWYRHINRIEEKVKGMIRTSLTSRSTDYSRPNSGQRPRFISSDQLKK